MFSKNLIWNKTEYNKLIKYLDSISEDKYKKFSEKLVFTKYIIKGIRIPILRKIAREINKTDIMSFLDNFLANFLEEVMLYGIVISYIKDYDTWIKYFDKFILYIDNWSICDACISSMKIVKENKKIVYEKIKIYLQSNEEFIIRVGLILLLDYYIDDDYIDDIFIVIDNIDSDKYYVNMAIAWLVSICFVKYRDKTIRYLNKNNLNKFTYNKSIQKMIESFRVSNDDKDMLRQMKRV